MNRVHCLQLVAAVTYYVGWLALVCAGLVQFSIARAMFAAITLTKRNLFEVSAILFLISIASAARAVASRSGEAAAKS